MRKAFQSISSLRLFWLLSGLFAVFYTIQIPFSTSNADVLVYAVRSMAPRPIHEFAFLDAHNLIDGQALPNYHLGHTLVLWLVYHIMPHDLAQTIWPAGFVSAISGGLSVGLTFLIWERLGFDRIQALATALITGMVPSIWYHSLIGEVYVLQLFATLLFLYCFLENRLMGATLSFLFANLISPLSGLSFTMVVLAHRNSRWILKALGVGAGALTLYILIFVLIQSNVLNAFTSVHPGTAGHLRMWALFKFGVVMALNINILWLYFLPGCRMAWISHRHVCNCLIVGTLPQLALVIVGDGFVIDLGCFQLLLFWACCLPIGLALGSGGVSPNKSIVLASGSAIVLLFFWLLPAQQNAMALRAAGSWLRAEDQKEIRIAGHWGPGTALTLYRYGLNLEALSDNYFDISIPNQEDLIKIGDDQLILAITKKPGIRQLLAKIPLAGFKYRIHAPTKGSFADSTQLIYENRAVQLYRWIHPQVAALQVPEKMGGQAAIKNRDSGTQRLEPYLRQPVHAEITLPDRRPAYNHDLCSPDII
jgi:hypothetical protein